MPGKPLPPLMSKLACAVAKGSSCRAACKALGIPYRTAMRWSVTPEFKGRVSAVQEQISAQVINRYRLRLIKNLDVLSRIIDAPTTDPETAVKAIRGVLADFIELQTHTDLSGRLAALEQRQEANRGHHR